MSKLGHCTHPESQQLQISLGGWRSADSGQKMAAGRNLARQPYEPHRKTNNELVSHVGRGPAQEVGGGNRWPSASTGDRMVREPRRGSPACSAMNFRRWAKRRKPIEAILSTFPLFRHHVDSLRPPLPPTSGGIWVRGTPLPRDCINRLLLRDTAFRRAVSHVTH